MNIAVVTDAQAAVLNEVSPILVFSLAFVLALGGAYAVGVMICGWGRVSVAQVDFWKGQVKIQCK